MGFCGKYAEKLFIYLANSNTKKFPGRALNFHKILFSTNCFNNERCVMCRGGGEGILQNFNMYNIFFI